MRAPSPHQHVQIISTAAPRGWGSATVTPLLAVFVYVSTGQKAGGVSLWWPSLAVVCPSGNLYIRQAIGNRPISISYTYTYRSSHVLRRLVPTTYRYTFFDILLLSLSVAHTVWSSKPGRCPHHLLRPCVATDRRVMGYNRYLIITQRTSTCKTKGENIRPI